MINRRRFGTWCAACLALAGASLLVGCYQPGGQYWSADTHTYWSTTWAPKTVSLLDSRTGETIWTSEVPVDQQLVVRFVEGKGTGANRPDLMQWEIMKRGRKFGSLANQTPVPAKHRRRIDMALRPAPEAPADAADAAPPVRDLSAEDSPPPDEATSMPTQTPGNEPGSEN